MQTYFFISLAVAIISYIFAVMNIANAIKTASFTLNTIYSHIVLAMIVTLSSLFTVGFGIAWIIEYYNTTH